jgi:hypothetical protein
VAGDANGRIGRCAVAGRRRWVGFVVIGCVCVARVGGVVDQPVSVVVDPVRALGLGRRRRRRRSGASEAAKAEARVQFDPIRGDADLPMPEVEESDADDIGSEQSRTARRAIAICRRRAAVACRGSRTVRTLFYSGQRYVKERAQKSAFCGLSGCNLVATVCAPGTRPERSNPLRFRPRPPHGRTERENDSAALEEKALRRDCARRRAVTDLASPTPAKTTEEGRWCLRAESTGALGASH